MSNLNELLNLLFYVLSNFIVDHMSEYMMKSKTTFHETSDEFVESVHHVLKTMEEKHNLAVRKKGSQGTLVHQDNLLKSICIFNYKNLGIVY